LGELKESNAPNVYEGVDYNTNKFLLPNYRLSRNLVQNPGFEDGFDFWTFYCLGRLKETHIFEHFQIDETNAFEGKRCLKILGEKGQFPAPPSTFAIPLQPGADYVFSLYAKTDKPGIASISVGGTTELWPNFIKGASFKPDSEWKRYSYKFTASQRMVTIFIGVDSPKEDCAVWIDAVQLEKAKELSEFACVPATTSLATDRRDNLFEPGEKTGAKLRVHSVKPSTKGVVDLLAKDFYGRTVKEEKLSFETGSDGVALLPLPWADSFDSGLYVFESSLKLDDGFANTCFSRLVKMKFLHNDFAHKDVFCSGSGDGRIGNWERKFDFWEKAGFGAAIHFDPPPDQYYKLMAKRNIITFSSIFEGGDTCLKGKFKLARRPQPGAKELWLDKITDEDLKAIEEEAYLKALEHPEIKAWKMLNEPLETPTPEEMKTTLKVVEAARKGILRADKNAKIITNDCANMSPSGGIKYLENYFESGGAPLTDIVGIHPYRQHPEDPDLDEDTKLMIKVTDKYKPGADVWFTEGMYFMNYNLPVFMLDAFAAPCGGDHFRGGYFSYDLGIGEKMSAAYSARYWLTVLKYADRVKLSVDWSAFSGRLYSGIDMTPQALVFASNTLGNLLRRLEIPRRRGVRRERPLLHLRGRKRQARRGGLELQRRRGARNIRPYEAQAQRAARLLRSPELHERQGGAPRRLLRRAYGLPALRQRGARLLGAVRRGLPAPPG